jgi:hypothetical protein
MARFLRDTEKRSSGSKIDFPIQGLGQLMTVKRLGIARPTDLRTTRRVGRSALLSGESDRGCCRIIKFVYNIESLHIRQSKRERWLPEVTNEHLEAQYLPEHHRRFAREAARAENYHVRASSTAS